MHVREREDEMFFVLEGHFTFYLDDQCVEADAGAFLFGPLRVPPMHVRAPPDAMSRCTFRPASSSSSRTSPNGQETACSQLTRSGDCQTPHPDTATTAGSAARWTSGRRIVISTERSVRGMADVSQDGSDACTRRQAASARPEARVPRERDG